MFHTEVPSLKNWNYKTQVERDVLAEKLVEIPAGKWNDVVGGNV